MIVEDVLVRNGSGRQQKSQTVCSGRVTTMCPSLFEIFSALKAGSRESNAVGQQFVGTKRVVVISNDVLDHRLVNTDTLGELL